MMSSFENFYSQFRGLVERAMLSEIEDMIRIISEGLARRHAEVSAHLDRASESLHAARRRERSVMERAFDPYHQEHVDSTFTPRNRIDVPACEDVDEGDAGPLPV